MLHTPPFELRGRTTAILAAFSAASSLAFGGAVIAPTIAHAATSQSSAATTQPAAPVITVSGNTLNWKAVAGATSYRLATILNPTTTRNTTYQTVTGTSFTPPVQAGQTVNYGLSVNTAGAPWATEATIAYPTAAPALTVSSDVLHWSSMTGVSSYTLATILNPTTTRNTTYQTVTGTSFTPPAVSGKSVNYGLEANVSGGNATWAKEATINWPGTTTAPAPAPATPLMRVGVNSLIEHNYIANLTNLTEGAGVNSDRIDVGTGSSLSLVTSAISMGLKPLVLYNPSSGSSPATYASQVQSLATRLKSLGLTEIEFVNEPDINGWTPQTYAAAYAAAHSAIAGMGMTLIAYTIGDYERADGTWSQDSNGGGWMRDFVAALPSPGAKMVDAWSAHLYGDSITTVEPQDSGWAALTEWRSIEESLGSNAPWYITEIGWNTSNVSDATQASNTTGVLNSALSKGYVAGVWFYTIIDDGTGHYGLFNLQGGASSASASDERPAFTSLASWMSAHASSTDG